MSDTSRVHKIDARTCFLLASVRLHSDYRLLEQRPLAAQHRFARIAFFHLRPPWPWVEKSDARIFRGGAAVTAQSRRTPHQEVGSWCVEDVAVFL